MAKALFCNINFLKAQLSLDRPVYFFFCKIPYHLRNKFLKWNGLWQI